MSFDHYLRRVMSGAERGPRAASLRAALAVAEPFYAAAVSLRNRMYDRRLLTVRTLPRPVVSIGNLTAGGTGKTPVVRWLASKLCEEGRRVAILSRGYRAAGGAGALGDEQLMLDRLLNGPAAAPGAPGTRSTPRVTIRAHPDRSAAADAALRECPDTDVFLLDDGFQHRRVARDLDVVLVNCTEPFGHGRVLPRGLLREPLSGLRRAGAVVLTHADRVNEAGRAQIESEIRRRRPDVPIFRAAHAPVAFRTSDSDASPLEALRARRVFAFCGLASPEAFERDVRNLSGSYAGHRWFADHHTYTPEDRAQIEASARAAGADVVVTTEKDWAKLADLSPPGREDLPVWRLDVAIQFSGDDESRLLAQVRRAISSRSAAPARAG
jgi:tetraacyldisaccharide 4'-kinase